MLLLGITASGAEKVDGRERFGIWLVETYRQSRSGSWTVGDARNLYRTAGTLAAADRTLAFAILGAWMREQAGRADHEAWWLSESMVRGAPPDPRRDPLQTQPTNGARTAAKLNLPAERTWAFQPEQAVLTAEWCRSLIALHRLPSVLGATEAWRAQVGGNRFAQAMLAMACADGMLQDDRIDQAVELISLAQGILGQVREAAYSGSDEAPDVRLGRAMVDDLAQCIHRRLEVERYGPGWVAYRDADALRRRDGELFGAMAGFRKVDQEYPGTILAVAARANRLVLQLQTSTKAYQAERQAWLKRARAQNDNLRQRLTQIEHDGFTSADRIAAQRALAAEQAGILAVFQAWPTDPRASGEQAWREAEAFIAEKPEGVYRCDVLLAQADWVWGETGDAGRARQRYDALLEWLVQVPARDSAVDGYIFEERIRAASAPPPAAIQQDDFGNQRWAALPPGTLINHRTCPWYVEYLTMRAAAGAGVCAFSVGDFAAASAYVDRLAKADPFEALRLAGKLQVSNTSRLRDGFATGRLFATATELALFGGQERSQLRPPKSPTSARNGSAPLTCTVWSVRGWAMAIARARNVICSSWSPTACSPFTPSNWMNRSPSLADAPKISSVRPPGLVSRSACGTSCNGTTPRGRRALPNLTA